MGICPRALRCAKTGGFENLAVKSGEEHLVYERKQGEMSSVAKEPAQSLHDMKKDKYSLSSADIHKKIDTSKINMEVMRRWIDDTIHKQLPDDDIAGGLIFELLMADENPDYTTINQQVTEFIGKKESRKFCSELWNHLLSAQTDKDGIPAEVLKQVKQIQEAKEKTKAEFYNKPKELKGTSTVPRRGQFPRDRAGKGRKTNYNRGGGASETSPRKQRYDKDHHDPRERGARDNTLL